MSKCSSGLERARFRRRVALTLAVASAAGVLVAVNAQAIGAWMATDVWGVWIVALGALAAMFALPGVPVEAAPGAQSARESHRPLAVSIAPAQ